MLNIEISIFNHMLRLILATFVIISVSCSTTGKKPQKTQSTHTTVIRTEVRTDTVHSVRTDIRTDTLKIKETESFRSLQKSIDSLLARRETGKAIEMLKQQVQYHNNLDQLGFRTVQLATLLHQTGQSAEALAVLEGFAVYKPAINYWIDSANTLYDRIISANRDKVVVDPAKQEAINALTTKIRNLKNVNASPALIISMADSLRALSPGDSVLVWLEKQLPSKTESSDVFCEEQRKFAAEKFAASRKNKAKANALLTEGIEALDKCLAQTPSADMRKKVQVNKEQLSKEL